MLNFRLLLELHSNCIKFCKSVLKGVLQNTQNAQFVASQFSQPALSSLCVDSCVSREYLFII